MMAGGRRQAAGEREKVASSKSQGESASSSLKPQASLPTGYAKSKAPKHDEHNPRPARPVGKPKVCQLCYRGRHDIFDHVCPRCMRDHHALALIEQEIAKALPATARLTSAEIMRRLWVQNRKLQALASSLKSQASSYKAQLTRLARHGAVGLDP